VNINQTCRPDRRYRGQPVGILSLDDVLNLLMGEFGPVRQLLERESPA
jgi:hypothetical protein